MKGDKIIDLKEGEIAKSDNPLFRKLSGKLIDTASIDFEKYQILTDNFSPVEYLTAEVYQSIN